jgi:hypothetical protein
MIPQRVHVRLSRSAAGPGEAGSPLDEERRGRRRDEPTTVFSLSIGAASVYDGVRWRVRVSSFSRRRFSIRPLKSLAAFSASDDEDGRASPSRSSSPRDGEASARPKHKSFSFNLSFQSTFNTPLIRRQPEQRAAAGHLCTLKWMKEKLLPQYLQRRAFLFLIKAFSSVMSAACRTSLTLSVDAGRLSTSSSPASCSSSSSSSSCSHSSSSSGRLTAKMSMLGNVGSYTVGVLFEKPVICLL